MPYIRPISHDESTGLLRRVLDAAVARAGRIWNIVGIMSPNPRVMDASMKLYGAVLFGPSPLSRVQRETLAVVTSAANDCFY
ncbi:MAG TPA: hypothetical protein VK858_17430 [Longimicrobiales bacterium]|nr:hypothetical protein [Longimicrobiales bacterium]